MDAKTYRTPVRLKGQRYAYLELPEDLTEDDKIEIKKWIDIQFVEKLDTPKEPE